MNFLNSIFEISTNYKLQFQSRFNDSRGILVGGVERKLWLQLATSNFSNFTTK
jgi:hypothetical protein